MIFLPDFDQQSNAAVPLLLLIPHPLHQQQFFPFLLPLFLYAISISPPTTNANHHNPSLASTPYLSPVLHPRHLQTRTSLFNQPPRAPSNTTALSTVRILQPFSAPQNLSTNSIHPPTHHLPSSAAFITTIPSHLLRTTISPPILTATVQQPLPLSFSPDALTPPNSPKSHISASQSPSPLFPLSSSATRHTPCHPISFPSQPQHLFTHHHCFTFPCSHLALISFLCRHTRYQPHHCFSFSATHLHRTAITPPVTTVSLHHRSDRPPCCFDPPLPNSILCITTTKVSEIEVLK